jgi:phospholipid transport system substrate-binding protein
VLLAAALADPVWAQTAESGAADPALAPIAAFDQSLLEAMKAGGGAAGVETRYRRLLPVVEKTFDLPTMMRFAVGPSWSGYSAAQQEGLVRAFGRLSAANLSHNFDSFSGQEFKLNPVVETRGPDKLSHASVRRGVEGDRRLFWGHQPAHRAAVRLHRNRRLRRPRSADEED